MFKRILSAIDSYAPAWAQFHLAASQARPEPAPDYRAVSIVPRLPACDAAQACIGKRLPLKPNTRLPLRDCSMPHQCSCRFKMHEDRRRGERRSESVTWQRMRRLGIDRRQARGRRATDVAPAAAAKAAPRPVSAPWLS